MATTSVDPAAVTAAGQRIAAAAEILAAAAGTHLGDMQFGPAAAGRAHGPAGEDLRRALERLRTDMTRWAQAAAELAAALNTGAERYRAAERHSASTLR